MSKNNNNTIILIDAPNLAFRMFFAMERTNMRTIGGAPTWATYGFFKAIFDLLGKISPKAIAAAYDCKEPTFRHKEYEEYKANRPEEMPEDLQVQWPHIREGLESFEIPIYELPGYEADDVIGTLAKKAAKEGSNVLILTGDRDAFQLINDKIKVLVPSKGELKEYGRQEVFDYWGIWPEQVIDFKSLCGDPSDNIPGIKGIGEKTAAKLLEKYKTLDNVFNNIKNIDKKALKERITAGKKNAYLSQRLATIKTDVPIKINLKDAHLTMPDMPKLIHFLQKSEFNSFIKRLPQVMIPFNNGIPPEIHNADRLAVDRPEQTKLTLVENKNDIETEDELEKPDIEVNSINTKGGLHDVIKEIKDKKYICIDLETTSVNSNACDIVGFGIAWFQDEKEKITLCSNIKGVYIPVGHNKGNQLDRDYVIKELKPILENKDKVKIAQNCKFEYKILKRHGIELGENLFDTMLASYVTDPSEKHGLKDQTARILNIRMTKIDELIGSGKKQISMAEVDIEKAAPYTISDVHHTIELAKHYKSNMGETLIKILKDIEIPLVPVLSSMELHGVRVDTTVLKELSTEIKKKAIKLEEEIFDIAKQPFNINSSQQLGKILFDQLGIEHDGKITKSGQFATDARTLEALIPNDKTNIIEKILEFRQLTKLISTYTDALPKQVYKETGNIHCEFNQMVTTTGRLSSSNPNLQNIPIRSELGRKIRKAFVSSIKGGTLFSADYSQIELRVLAHMTEDATLIKAFRDGEDIHKRTAMEIYGVSEDKITSEMRSHGKTLNFALIYQQGPYATARQLDISQKEAQNFIAKYFKSFPKVKPCFETLLENAKKNGYVETMFGRRRYFKNLNIKNKSIQREDERAALNAPLQGTAADIMKLAMIKLHHTLKAKQSRLIMQVHDELILDVHPDEKTEMEKIVIDAMELDQPLKVPLVIDTSWGKNWYDCG